MTTKRDKRTPKHQRCVERIKRLRKMEGISQVRAAELLNWTSASYSDVEAYNKQLTLDKLDELARLYRVTIGFLAEGIEAGVQKDRLRKIKGSIEFM